MTEKIPPMAVSIALILSTASLAAEGEGGFVSIFNGKDLSGWEGEEGFWTVEDGAITGESTPENPVRLATYLMWRGGKVADFELRFSYRIPAGDRPREGQGRQQRDSRHPAPRRRADEGAGEEPAPQAIRLAARDVVQFFGPRLIAGGRRLTDNGAR